MATIGICMAAGVRYVGLAVVSINGLGEMEHHYVGLLRKD